MTANPATEIRVRPGDTVTITVHGPAVIHVRPSGPPGASETAPAAGSRPALPGLAEAVSLITARVHGMPGPGLSEDVSPAAVAAALTILATAFLDHLLPLDRRSALLTDLGLAAQEGTG